VSAVLPGRRRRPASRRLAGEVAQVVATVAAVLLIWQAAAVLLKTPSWLLPPPTAVAVAMADHYAYLAEHSVSTLRVVIVGFIASVVVGSALGVVIGYSRIAEQTLMRLLVGSQSIPKLAIAPLLVIWLGLGDAPKIVMTFVLCFFPITVAMVQGLHATNRDVLELAAALGANPLQSFGKIRFPASLPYLFTGLKVAASLAVIGAVVGEFIGGDEGLGYVLLLATAQVQGPLAYAALVLLASAGIVLFGLVGAVERALIPWARTTAAPEWTDAKVT
jgi:NitT/TauT family transport system permease protein